MSSPFASRITTTIPVEFDLPHEVTIQKLAARHLERARKTFFSEMVQEIQSRGGAAVQKDVEQLFGRDPKQEEAAQAEAREKAKADPLNGLNLYWIVASGVKAWTYPESLRPEPVLLEDGTTAPRIMAILDLDEDALRWFATEVMRVTKPAAFRTVEEQEADRKND
jgi:hypothetical protein